MAVAQAPHIALIGGGYTLQKVAALLPPGFFVITSRDATTCAAWREMGWNAFQLSLEDPKNLAAFFDRYPSISCVVDSVPPIRSSSNPALGVKNLCAAMRGRGVQKVIYLSTTGVFGVRDGSVVTEETPARPWNQQGEARWLSEEAYRSSGIPFTALRLPAIYGPDRGLLQSIREGSYRLVEGGTFWTNRIHVDDLARCVERAIATDGLPSVLCVSDDAPTLAREVAEFVCAKEGLPLPGFVSADEVLSRGGFTMLSNQRVQNALMKQLLGVTLRYPSYREGLYS